MTREELEHIHTTTLHMAETPQRATLKSYVFRLQEALEVAWKERDAYKFAGEQAIGMGTAKAIMDERDQLKHRVRELERGEYICKKCGLRKDGETQAADF